MTEIDRLQEKLEECEKRCRLLTEMAPDAVVVVQKDGRFTYANCLAFGLFGVKVFEQLQEKSFYDYIDSRDLESVRAHLLKSLPNGEQSIFEFRLIQSDGLEAVVEAASIGIDYEGASSYQLIIRDISERRRTEDILKISEANLKLAVQSTGLGLFDYYPQTGRLIWSDSAKLHYGLPPEAEADIEVFYSGLHPDDREFVRQAVQDALQKENEGDFNVEYRTIGIQDGKERWIATRGQVYFDNQGNAVRFTGACLDISDRKKKEQSLKDEISLRLLAVEELRRQERMLIQQNRFAAMGEMIGNIAHQWRQPLNNLALLVQDLEVMYESECLTKECLQDNVAKAMQMILHMSQTIDDFRNFFKPDKKKILFKVSEVVGKAVSIVEATFAEQYIAIEINIHDDFVMDGCPNEFSQVILNILVNAKDEFLRRNIDNPRIAITTLEELGKKVLTIADNAGGVPDAIIEKIFDPYFTTKGPEKRTGVGLFMSKIIVTNMKGILTVVNTGQGAEFRVEFPIEEEK